MAALTMLCILCSSWGQTPCLPRTSCTSCCRGRETREVHITSCFPASQATGLPKSLAVIQQSAPAASTPRTVHRPSKAGQQAGHAHTAVRWARTSLCMHHGSTRRGTGCRKPSLMRQEDPPLLEWCPQGRRHRQSCLQGHWGHCCQRSAFRWSAQSVVLI